MMKPDTAFGSSLTHCADADGTDFLPGVLSPNASFAPRDLRSEKVEPLALTQGCPTLERARNNNSSSILKC